MADIKKIAEELVNLSVKDVSELANILKDEYGIEPAAAATVVAGGGGAGGDAGGDAAEVEKVMDNTLADFLRKGPNAKALKNIRTEVVSGLIFGLQRIGGFGGKSDILATYETFYDDPGAYKDIYEMYMSIPRTEIKNISKKSMAVSSQGSEQIRRS